MMHILLKVSVLSLLAVGLTGCTGGFVTTDSYSVIDRVHYGPPVVTSAPVVYPFFPRWHRRYIARPVAPTVIVSRSHAHYGPVVPPSGSGAHYGPAVTSGSGPSVSVG